MPVTYHVVIAFDRDAEGNLKPSEAREVMSPIVAERRARALALAPTSLPARINLADLERSTGRDREAEALLRETTQLHPKAAIAWHALGLSLVRLGHRPEAIDCLAKAAALAPGDPDYAYAYQLALREADRAQGDPAARARD